MRIEITALTGLPEVRAGDDVAALIRACAIPGPNDIVVVAQKIVSKAEGCVVNLCEIEPSQFARAWAAAWGKDARLVELILRESSRIVKMDRGLLIAETRHGLVAANAGVDQSNVAGEGRATVLPRDPDGSARRIHEGLGCGAVIITDTFGRPWREGLVNVAIGLSGMEALEDWRGRSDAGGRTLGATIIATADEVAAAAGLVMRKDARIPVAIVSGYSWQPAQGSARLLIRAPERDLFR